MLLDNTGTFTDGHMTVADVYPDDQNLIPLAASAEIASEHPVAMVLSRAFVLGNSLRILGWSPRRNVMGASFVVTTVSV